MSDGSVRDVCARIRARAHATVEAQRQQQPAALTRDDMAADLFALRTLYLVSFSFLTHPCRVFFFTTLSFHTFPHSRTASAMSRRSASP